MGVRHPSQRMVIYYHSQLTEISKKTRELKLLTGCGLTAKPPVLGTGHHESSNLSIPTASFLHVVD